MALALRSIDLSGMISLSAGWLGPHRAALAAAPELAALLPRLEEAHKGLLAARQAAPASSGEQTQRLGEQALAVDERHDHAVRALYFAVSASLSFVLASEDPDPEAVGRLEALRDMILPEGLATTEASYEAEAAMASRAAEAVASDPEAQQLLGEIRLRPRVSGLDLLALWSDLGNKLGSIELKRSAKATGDNPVRARNAWLSVVASMLSVLSVLRSDELNKLIVAPLTAACNKASRGRKKG